jgi:hypothetical protein
MGIFLRMLMATAMNRLVPGWLAGVALTICCLPAGAIDLAAIELAAIGQVRGREQAAADVASARQAVAAAREKTDAARQRLDDFLANHFELSGKVAAHPAAPQVPAQNADSPPAVDPEVESSRAQLDDLRAERGRLLVTLTEAHPEVVDVDDRIANAEGRLQSILSAKSSELPVFSDPQAAAEDQQRSQTEAEEFRRLFADWKACEQSLEQARDAESKAVDLLAALPIVAPIAEKPAEPTPANQALQMPSASIVIDDRVEPSTVPPTATKGAPIASSAGSQTLALAALAVALAISALAAVKLSRAGADPLFASADDVAAALAVPVVGIVPAAAAGNRVADPAALRRTVVVGLQILVAVTVFLAVAYLVQHIEDLTRFCANPVTAIRGWFGL